MTDKVLLAFSGGLDTSVCVKLLEEKYNVEVITACVDVGQGEEEMEKAKNSAAKIGGLKHYNIDAKEEFANEYIARGIKANAEYEGYPLSTAFARPLIAKKLIEVAEKEGATAIAHGCTGKGNDQFRFEAVILAMSDLDIIAPIREMNLTRTEEVAYAKEHGLNLSYDKIYSIDENLWGRAIEGDVLEDPANEPPEEIYEWTKSAEDAKDTPTKVSIEFEEGVPIAINIENGIAAMALAQLSGVSNEEIKKAMATFRGVDRRFDFKIKNEKVVFLSDYAHHPEEIKQSILSMRALYTDKKLTAVFQPHLYTRTRDFYQEFADSLSLLDEVILTEIYPAREEPIPGISSELIYNHLRPDMEKCICKKENLIETLSKKDIEVLITLGAGDIDNYVPQICELLNKR